jgi:hypothetical protein
MALMKEFSACLTAWNGDSSRYILMEYKVNQDGKIENYYGIGDENGHVANLQENDVFEMIDDWIKKKFKDDE